MAGTLKSEITTADVAHVFRERLLKATHSFVAVVIIGLSGVISFCYFKDKRIVDDWLLRQSRGDNLIEYYSAPPELRVGQRCSIADIAKLLRAAGYGPTSELGSFEIDHDTIWVKPGPMSYHAQEPSKIVIEAGLITSLLNSENQRLVAYELEPIPMRGSPMLQDRAYPPEQPFSDIPETLVQGVIAAEGPHFFGSNILDLLNVGRCAIAKLLSMTQPCQGLTLTIRLAGTLLHSSQKEVFPRVSEGTLALQLELRFTKQKLFQMYASTIDLGHHESITVRGFREAANVYFGKDLDQLSLPEAALLAGMIRNPNRYSPFKNLDRSIERRNAVLDAMVGIGAVSQGQADAAKNAPLTMLSPAPSAIYAPDFIEVVQEQVAQRGGSSRGPWRVYTTLDPDLQTVAYQAIKLGTERLDALTQQQDRSRARSSSPQLALVALNPHTGGVLALVGHRSYDPSEPNYAVVRRRIDSLFQPFVFAAAFNSSLTGNSLNGLSSTFTPVTILGNRVTARTAFIQSQGTTILALAEKIGTGTLYSLAHDAGISTDSSIGMGIDSFSATPLAVAGAYTSFAGSGVMVEPWLLASLRKIDGSFLHESVPITSPILDPRVSFLTTSLMNDVVDFGIAHDVRLQGFAASVAAETGPGNDAWFVGFTSNLICVVWVGNPDGTPLDMTGMVAAAPIWIDFMKRASQLRQYAWMPSFVPPPGLTSVRLDKTSNLLADANCPDSYKAVFLAGTEPKRRCPRSLPSSSVPPRNSDQRNLFQRIFGTGSSAEETPSENQKPN